MNLMTTIHLLVAGFIIGIIFFQTALSAPIVFTYLQKEQSSIYIRKIFPRLFILLFCLGVVSVCLELANESSTYAALICGLITSILSALCYLMVPATNKATDSGNQQRFKLLHTLSVVFILIVFFANMWWPFA